MKSAKDILNGAITLLETEGWTQDGYFTKNGCCVMGALRKAASPDEPYSGAEDCESFRTARALLASFIGSRSPVSWNDTPGRTKEEVIAALRGASEVAE